MRRTYEDWGRADEEAAVQRWRKVARERELDNLEGVIVRLRPTAGVRLRLGPRPGAA